MLWRWLGARHLLLGVLLGIISAGLVAGAIGFAVIVFGLYDAAATSPHSLPVAWVVHTTMIRSVRLRAHAMGFAPRVTAADVALGARLYGARCQVCHGGPGIARAQWANGLNPNPPYLLDAAQRWSPQEMRLIVGEGVKMTAMPAWRFSMNDRQLWALVAFLRALPKLNRAQYLAATQGR